MLRSSADASARGSPQVVKPATHWTTRSFPPPLLPGEVHVWRVAIPDADAVPPSWHGLLTTEEHEQVARKRIALDARRTLASRACLRSLLGGYLDAPPNSLAFATTPAGKPRLVAPAGAAAIEFNVSHSGAWLVLAFAHDQPVGVDVEWERDLDHHDLVIHFFSPQERTIWSAIPVGERARAFFSAWTRKEAYLKALGLGLSKPLDSFSVEFRGDLPAALVSCDGDPAAPQRWRIVPIDLAPDYACALAVESTATTLHAFTLDYS